MGNNLNKPIDKSDNQILIENEKDAIKREQLEFKKEQEAARRRLEIDQIETDNKQNMKKYRKFLNILLLLK